MPHLTSAATGTASTDLRVGFGIPGYAHPLVAPVEWGELTRPGTPLHWVVLNVADGPGTRPDPRCLEAAGRLRNAGVRVLGHLDVTYGARAFGELVSDAHRYLDWYQVDGFLLDRCPTERTALPEVRRTATTLRALLGGRAHRPRPRHPPVSRICRDRRPVGDLRRALERLPLVAGGRVDRRIPARALLPLRARRAPWPSRRGAAHRPLAGRLDDLLHRPHGPRAVRPTPGRACPATGTKSSRGSERVSRNEEGRGSVTGRTTVVIDRPTESPCRCHPWSSQLLSSP